MIGNGWIDAMHQYPAYLQYAVKHGLVEEGSKEYQRGKKATDECMSILESGSASHVPVHVDICEQLLSKVAGMAEGATTGMCLNMYDVRLQDSYPECGMNWPPPLHNITNYLRVRIAWSPKSEHNTHPDNFSAKKSLQRYMLKAKPRRGPSATDTSTPL